jgi:PST family polysaccharide transporter
MEQRAIRGVPWTLLAYAASKAVGVVTVIVLARLLVPADFGVVALALIAIDLVYVIGEMGLGSALILRPDLDRRGEGTVLGMLIASDAAMAVGLAATAPLVASLVGEPRLRDVLIALAVLPLLSGPVTFYNAVMQRDLAFRRSAAAQMVRPLVAAVVSVGLAVAGAGVWSLVVGQIASFVVYGALVLRLAPYAVAPVFDLLIARDVLTTGRGFLTQSGVAYLQQNIDYVVVGRVLGAGPLGAYSLAFRQAELPHWAIADPVAKVTFPAFARMRGDREGLERSYVSVFKLIALICCPLGVLLSALAEPFTSGLLGERWLAAIAPLAVLGILGAVRPLQATMAWLLNSVGHAGLMSRISAIALIPLAPAAWIAASYGGLTAVAYVVLGHVVLETIALAIVIQRRCAIRIVAQARAVLALAVALVPTWFVAHEVGQSLSADAVAALVAGGLAGLLTYIVALGLLDRGELVFVVRQTQRLLRPS